MLAYAKTNLPRTLSVRSIVTVFRDIRFPSRSADAGETHDFWEFIYIRRGTHSLRLGEETVSLAEGELLFYPPNVYHGGTDEASKALADIVSFEGDLPLPFALYGRPFPLNAAQKATLTAFLSEISPLFCRAEPSSGKRGMVLREGVEPNDLQRLRGQLELFLLDLLSEKRKEGETPSRLRREQMAALRAYFSENIGRSLSLAEIARETKMGVSNLKVLVRRECACGVLAYFLQMKIECAKELLSDTGLGVAEIADRLGFSSANYFSKLFKEKTGVSPSEYGRAAFQKK